MGVTGAGTPVAGRASGMDLGSVIKPPTDKKEYRVVHLENGLTCILAYDPDIILGDESDKEDDGNRDMESGSESEAPRDSAMNEAQGSDEVMDDKEESETGSEDSADDIEGGGSEDEGEGGTASRKHPGAAPKQKKRAAAAMTVGIGSFSDPVDLPGLSHYLEHMLFMGSEKFPEENEYDQYLQQHGGFCNAFTDAETTTYYFDVQGDFLRGALERFSGFFTKPLCLEESLEREVVAVDNEFSGCLQSDTARMMQLLSSTAAPGHPAGMFSWGNKASLWDTPKSAGINVRERVLEHYRTLYSAERMTLFLVGGQDLDTLQAWARELFDAVPSGKGPKPSFAPSGMPFRGDGLCILAPSVTERHFLEVTFQLPSLLSEYGKKAEDYVAHCIGHEAKGSLLSALKARGIASDLAAGVEACSGADRNTAFFLFTVGITLTERGARDACGREALEMLFGYIAMLRARGPQRWIWDELKLVSEMKFRFAEEDDSADLASAASVYAQMYRPEHVLCADYLFDEYDPDLITRVLDHLRPDCEGLRVVLSTTLFEELKSSFGGEVAAEPWFNLVHLKRPISSAEREAWCSVGPTDDMTLPARNDFLCSDFEIRPAEEPTSLVIIPSPPESVRLGLAPTLAIDRPGLRLWHKRDWQFPLPRAVVYVRIASPALRGDGRRVAMASLCRRLLLDALTEASYMADLAGIVYTVESGTVSQGLEFKVEGFSHKLPRLAELIFDCLAHLPQRVSEEDFSRVKEALMRRLRNLDIKPHKQAHSARLYALRPDCEVPVEVEKAAEVARLSDVGPFLEEVLSSTHLDCYVHGNLSLPEAMNLATTLRGIMDAGDDASRHLKSSEVPLDHVVRVPEGNHVFSSVSKNPDEDNSALEAYFQAELDTHGASKERVVGELLEQILSEPFFNQLRTKEQLGYSLSCGSRMTHGFLGFGAQIQSGAHSAAYLRERLEAFLQDFRQTLVDMPEDEFQRHRRALVAFKAEKDAAMWSDALRVWGQISTHRYQFYLREADLKALEAVTLADAVAFYDRVLLPGSLTRRAVFVEVDCESRVHGKSPYGDAKTPEERRLAGDKAHTDLMARAAAWRAQQKVHDMVTGSPALPWDV